MENQSVQRPYLEHTKNIPPVIPQEVLSQLRECLPSLPPPIGGMIHLLLETGMRVKEVCALPFDCLVQDSSGGSIRYLDTKVQQEKVMPLSTEVVEMLQKQQRATKQEQSEGTVHEYLFLNANDKPFSTKTFLDMLNLMARERNIRDNAGVVWQFRVHQFRHTFGRKLLINNASLDVITRFFGHRSYLTTLMYSRVRNIDHKHKTDD